MPKIKGQDTSKLNKLPYDVMQDRRAFFIECDAKCADYLRELISLIKTLKPVGTTKTVLEQYWGQNARISEILTDTSTPGEIKNLAKMAQYHARYNASMVSDSLIGVTNSDAKATLLSDESGRQVLSITLWEVFLQYFYYPSDKAASKEQKLFAEVHQGPTPGAPITIIVPNTPEVEHVVTMMNKNLPIVLTSILRAQGFEHTVINNLIKVGVCPTQVAKMSNCRYDEKTRSVSFIQVDEQEKALESLTNAPWFKSTMDISQLLRDKQKKDAPPPELLFDIDGTRSLNTIHKKAKASKTTPKQKKSTKIAFDVRSSSDSDDDDSNDDANNSNKDYDSDEDSTSPHYVIQ